MPIEARDGDHQGYRADRFGLLAGRILAAVANRIVCGSLLLIGPDGTQHKATGHEPGPAAMIAIRRWRVLRRLVSGGSIGFAESYIDGDWDTPNLSALLTLFALNERHLRMALAGTTPGRLIARFAHLGRPNTRTGAAKNIQHHYDLGNAFYSQWLDPTLTYSSAIFPAGVSDLEEAQVEKYRRIARIADLQPGHEVLEIGCGWGGFARWAAKEIGCHVTGVTISPAQQIHADTQARATELCNLVQIHRIDYRDIAGSYDRIVSIEMFEAVGERYWPVFFDTLRRHLRPKGRAALQVITIGDEFFERYRRGADFVQRYIFPGGMLPSRTVLHSLAVATGFRCVADDGFGHDYARTLSVWHDRFEQAWDSIATLGFDRRFHRLWRYYLAYCEAGFRADRIDVRQIALTKT
jgi:cyclopropane-fatty-acyl-phospholipid synthase